MIWQTEKHKILFGYHSQKFAKFYNDWRKLSQFATFASENTISAYSLFGGTYHTYCAIRGTSISLDPHNLPATLLGHIQPSIYL